MESIHGVETPWISHFMELTLHGIYFFSEWKFHGIDTLWSRHFIEQTPHGVKTPWSKNFMEKELDNDANAS